MTTIHPPVTWRSRQRTHRTLAALLATMALLLIGWPRLIAPVGAATNPAADLDQCANGPLASPAPCTGAGWQNGNLNQNQAHYAEGESVPYRLRMSNLSTDAGNVHTVEIAWDTIDAGKNALDYLTSFDRTETTAEPWSGTAFTATDGSTFTIPVDPHLTTAGVTPAAGAFTLYGGTITAVSSYTYTSKPNGEITSITITFTASSASPVLAWGGHIASRTDWGDGNSASAIPGSPYHMRLLDLDGQGGNQDRSLSSSAVSPPPATPSISVLKTAAPTAVPETGGPVTFTYVVTNDGPDAVTVTSLVDDVYGSLAGDADCAVGTVLDPGASCEFSVSRTVAGDVGGPDHRNVFTAIAVDGNGAEVTASDDAVVTFTDVQPLIAVEKEPSAVAVRVGDPVTYTYKLTNPGVEPLTNVVLTDDRCSSVEFLGGDADSDQALDSGEMWVYSCTATLTGTTINTATAVGTDDDGNEARATATAKVDVIDARIAIQKIAARATAAPGETMTYFYYVTNPGTDPLGNVVVVDDRCSPLLFESGDIDTDGLLEFGEEWAFSCRVAMPDVEGPVTNIATATATDSLGGTVTADAAAIVDVRRPPAAVLGVTIAKTGSDQRGAVSTAALLFVTGVALLLAGRRRRVPLSDSR